MNGFDRDGVEWLAASDTFATFAASRLGGRYDDRPRDGHRVWYHSPPLPWLAVSFGRAKFGEPAFSQSRREWADPTVYDPIPFKNNIDYHSVTPRISDMQLLFRRVQKPFALFI